MARATEANPAAPAEVSLDPAHGGLDTAIELLAAGEVIGIPTETVYGLAGDAANPASIARIYALKGRPANHPVIVHLPPEGDPLAWAATLPDAARRLIDAFWPGPLTLILPRAAGVSDAVTGGQDTVGLRCPSHPLAQALFRGFSARVGGQGGIAAPSANRFGRVSPTTAAHVVDEFGGRVPVLDGGACEVGIESTIVDVSRGFAALLRPGQIGAAQLAEALGEMPRLPDGSPDPSAPRASGTLSAHYAPDTPLLLLDADAIAAALAARRGDALPVVAVLRPDALRRIAAGRGVEVVAAPADPDAYARELYAMLRRLDSAAYSQIYIETLPATLAWQAVNDRLGRAAAAFRAGH
ncbi:L-threonylcarbamoyladenylate synthase [Chitinasiproducens palmae]|uniref:Threonylcarbamoyl-AMP synthase n=1 Tax=Chitinasiproducens palmae TaxID=1770053 RepID=A0A1H2PY52_9BURK|nr:L-threonylcarbamoyladenylate synthase [Chitinasiproducens palmae]SDV51624.1 translation factor SUA5 [Chitinasiproducens palmae]